MSMETSAIHKLVHAEFAAAVGPLAPCPHGDSIEVDAARIADVAAFMKAHEDLRFDSLSNLTGVDFPDRGKIEVVYELYSYTHGHSIVLKVDSPREAPTAKTVSGVWRAAEWLEREAYDLVGMIFEGHRDLRRILLPDDWVGFPLRKDYVEAPDYHGISTVRESILNIENRH
jgi:NADH-quinone oxidoreductase subunit C